MTLLDRVIILWATGRIICAAGAVTERAGIGRDWFGGSEGAPGAGNGAGMLISKDKPQANRRKEEKKVAQLVVAKMSEIKRSRIRHSRPEGQLDSRK